MKSGRGSGGAAAVGEQLSLPIGWCQRWTNRRHSWRHISEGGFDRRGYLCRPIPEPLARQFIARHHYARSFPAATRSFGMFEGPRLVGVAVLGVPVRAAVLTGPFPDLEPYRQASELSRLCLVDQVAANGESYFLGRLFAYLRRETDVRGLVAFSDPQPRYAYGRQYMPGHFGAVYQATSARYLGRGRARWLTQLPDGTTFNDRTRAKILAGDTGWRYATTRLVQMGARPPESFGAPDAAWVAAALADVGATRVRHGGNLRYAFPLYPRVRIGMATHPYPKRDMTAR